MKLIMFLKVYRIRSEFLKAILRQDVGWYDTKSSNDFASRITEYVTNIHLHRENDSPGIHSIFQ